jgi:hypothetical protein
MAEIILDIPKAHEAQQLIDDCDARFIVAVCGRRFGKTSAIPRKRIKALLSGKPGAYFAPTYKMMSQFFDSTKNLLAPIISNVNKSEHRMEFIGGGSLTMWSLDNPDSIRGQKYAFADIDEAAMVRDLGNAWNAVIRPTLTDYEGDAAFWSTPKGAGTFFHSIYLRGLGDHPEWKSFQFPTSSNPFINAKEIEAAREELPAEIFRQEYLAEFVAGEGQVFRNITANLTAEPCTASDHRGHTLVAGVDWGQVADFTAVSVICTDCKTEVVLDRFNKIDWEFQRARILSILNEWGVKFALVEENSIGSPNLEALQKSSDRAIKGFLTTAQSKPPLIQSLALAFEQNEIRWLNVATATAELEAYEATRNEMTNRIAYSAPKGMHDDTVIARALAREAIEQKKNAQWQFSQFRF